MLPNETDESLIMHLPFLWRQRTAGTERFKDVVQSCQCQVRVASEYRLSQGVERFALSADIFFQLGWNFGRKWKPVEADRMIVIRVVSYAKPCACSKCPNLMSTARQYREMVCII